LIRNLRGKLSPFRLSTYDVFLKIINIAEPGTNGTKTFTCPDLRVLPPIGMEYRQRISDLLR